MTGIFLNPLVANWMSKSKDRILIRLTINEHYLITLHWGNLLSMNSVPHTPKYMYIFVLKREQFTIEILMLIRE